MRFRSFTRILENALIFSIAIILIFISNSLNNLFCEEQNQPLEQGNNPIIVSEKSSIENFTVIIFSNTIYFSLIGYNVGGIESIKIMNGPQLLKEKNCMKNEFCKVTGSIEKEMLSSIVIDGIVCMKGGWTEREKIRINSFLDGKMYAVANILSKDELPPVPPAEMSSKSIVEEDKSTDYKITSKKSANGVNLSIVVRDIDGINYIEVLEDDEFKDVMLCRGSLDCTFDIEFIKRKDKNSSKCTIKIRDQKGNLTTEEKTLNY